MIVKKVIFGKMFRKNFFRLMYENDRVTTREAELFPQNLNPDVIRRFFTEGCRQAKTRAGIRNATILAEFLSSLLLKALGPPRCRNSLHRLPWRGIPQSSSSLFWFQRASIVQHCNNFEASL
ncbi:hypothetical protein [Caballeronia sp. GAWG1-1]|uniref:hypothetical protein n=1 Tax=Caballeronia sp. GAWG1-1 TaxID=2921742 RepID=UPI0020284135|nr:hypothetical protein [Caballeronia sp. GAWG1-1]